MMGAATLQRATPEVVDMNRLMILLALLGPLALSGCMAPAPKPNDPSFASMREQNLPPTFRSTVEAVVSQTADAAFHALISSGEVYLFQTSVMGAEISVETVIFIVGPEGRDVWGLTFEFRPRPVRAVAPAANG